MRLAEVNNIIGLKDATGNLERAEDLISRLKGSDFMLYSGDDATACDFMLMGGHGDISVTANVAPKPCMTCARLLWLAMPTRLTKLIRA